MNLQSIRIFLAIVNSKSISGAARALHFTQPTVSEYLNQLERKLGTQLVVRERGSRQVMLTPAGEAFVPIAQRWMELDEQVDHFVQAQEKKIFRLAASSAAHEYIISPIVAKLMRDMPGLEIRLLPVEMREIPMAVEKRTFDMALSFSTAPVGNQVTKISFYHEGRCLLCPADTELPDRVLSPEDLDPRYEVVYLPNRKNTSVAQWHQTHFPEEVRPYFQVSVAMAAHHYLTHPRSWVLLPISTALTLCERNPGTLVIRYVDPVPSPRKASLLIARAYPNAEVVQAFLKCCEEYVDERPYLENRMRPL